MEKLRLKQLVINPAIYFDSYNHEIGKYLISDEEGKVSPFVSEAFNKKRLKELETLCMKLNITITSQLDLINNYIKSKNYSLSGFMNLGIKLEQSILSQLYQDPKYRYDLYFALLMKNKFHFLKNSISHARYPSYRNINYLQIKKSLFPVYNPCISIIIYQISQNKGWNLKLPLWYKESFLPMYNFLCTLKHGDSFSIKELHKLDLNGKFLKYALNQSYNLGLITPKSNDVYINLKNKNDIDGNNPDIKILISYLNKFLGKFQEAYVELLRQGFLIKKNQEKYYEIEDRRELMVNQILIPPITFILLPKKANISQRIITALGKNLLTIDDDEIAGVNYFSKQLLIFKEKNIKLF